MDISLRIMIRTCRISITFVLLHIDELVRPDMDAVEISSLADTAIGMLNMASHDNMF
jgi:hypothetical protein